MEGASGRILERENEGHGEYHGGDD
jgi:hypothetical protein